MTDAQQSSLHHNCMTDSREVESNLAGHDMQPENAEYHSACADWRRGTSNLGADSRVKDNNRAHWLLILDAMADDAACLMLRRGILFILK